MGVAVTGGRRIGPYELIEQIGQGGSAVVYRAYDAACHRDVAVKVISGAYAADPTFRARFRQEADLVSGLRHPHILQVLDSAEAAPATWGAAPERVAYLVTEYMPGGSLADALRTPATLRAGARERCLMALGIAQQIGAALDWAHAAGVLHRDVKPSNVLIAPDGRYVLGDFGLARVLQAGASLHLTASGQVAGTPAYMAPEQALGQPADASTDTYSLAVVLYEALAGRVPFEAESPMAVMLAHVHQPPPAPHEVAPDVPAAVSAIVLDALAKQREARPRCAAELAAQLHAAVAGVYGESSITTGVFARLPSAGAPELVAATLSRESSEAESRPALVVPAEQAERERLRRAAVRSAHRPAIAAVAARSHDRSGNWRAPALIAGVLAGAVLLGTGAGAVALGPARPRLAGLLSRYIQDAVPLGVANALPRDNSRVDVLRPTITVYFSQAMDQQSVLDAFLLEAADTHETIPVDLLDFEWEGQMLQVTPQVDLRYGTAYHFVVETTARDLDGRELGGRLERRFMTVAEPPKPPNVAVAEPAQPSQAALPATEQPPTALPLPPTPPLVSPTARVIPSSTATQRTPPTITPAAVEEVRVAGLLMDASGATKVLDGSDDGELATPTPPESPSPSSTPAGTPPPATTVAPPAGSATPTGTVVGATSVPGAGSGAGAAGTGTATATAGAGSAAATSSAAASAGAATASQTATPARASNATASSTAAAGSTSSPTAPAGAGNSAPAPASPAVSTATPAGTAATSPAGAPTGSAGAGGSARTATPPATATLSPRGTTMAGATAAASASLSATATPSATPTVQS